MEIKLSFNDAQRLYPEYGEFFTNFYGSYILKTREIFIHLCSDRFRAKEESLLIEDIISSVNHEVLHYSIHSILRASYWDIDDENTVRRLNNQKLRPLRKQNTYK